MKPRRNYNVRIEVTENGEVAGGTSRIFTATSLGDAARLADDFAGPYIEMEFGHLTGRLSHVLHITVP